eukprot:TRINITY_DN2838_c1_g3_i1.p1 TRINITY_DN2838_c1_g3~~TRINITY_DN2838_c1_g3_i1.p1  ORF type:complete len:280 (+),score=105.11 TRINITY_DN2838_c1_g3_i1:482-1321(+)
MFETIIQPASILKKIIDAIEPLIQTANLDCSVEGITMQALDVSLIALVMLNLRSEGFEDYRCDRPMTLGINFKSIQKFLKCADNSDIIHLSAEQGKDTLDLTFNSQQDEQTSKFKCKLLRIDEDHFRVTDTPYSTIIEMPSAKFARIIRDLSLIGDETLSIKVTKTGVTFGVNGDVGEGNITVKPFTSIGSESESVIIEMEEEVHLNFGMKYFRDFAKAAPLSEKVILRLRDAKPVIVEYEILDMGSLRFYLAPLLENADSDNDEEETDDEDNVNVKAE